MSTSGNFTPPGTPPCPAPMTRAALLALRAAGQLRTECHYVITDGPVIGTAGNTSPTQIELHATSPTELGQTAAVHTAFDNTAWTGFYDIDLGAAGSIVFLSDPANNRVSDPDANSPTVHTQFPWHAWGPSLRDNLVNDSTLVDWGPAINAGGTITDNEIRNSIAVLTGRTGPTSTFNNNRLSNATVILNPPTSFFAQNNLDQATVTHAGATAGSFSFQNNTMLTGTFTVDSGTDVQVTANGNIFGGAAGGYRVQIVGKVTNRVTFSGNRCYNVGIGAPELLVSGQGLVQITRCNLNATDASIDGDGATTFTDCTVNNGSIDKGPTVAGPFTVLGTLLNGVALTVTGTGVGGAHVELCALSGSTVTLTAGSSGVLTVREVNGSSSVLTFSASGATAPTSENGRVTGTTLDTAGFQISVFEITGGTKTLTADQTDRVRNALGSNLI